MGYLSHIPFQGCGEQQHAWAAGDLRHTEVAGFPVLSGVCGLLCLRAEWWDMLCLLMEQWRCAESEQKLLGSCGYHTVGTGSGVRGV